MVDGTAATGRAVWDTCDYRLSTFSPDGSLVVGSAPDADGYGSPTLAILDATTGERIVDFEVAGPATRSSGSTPGWPGRTTTRSSSRVMSGEDFSIVRLGLDGTVQRVDIPSAGAPGRVAVAEVR